MLQSQLEIKNIFTIPKFVLDGISFVVKINHMWRYILVILCVISCPRPGMQKITPPDFLEEARRVYQNNPLYAYSLLSDSTLGDAYKVERINILARLYLEQREYERAAVALDSIEWNTDLSEDEIETILLKTERWDMLAEQTTDTLIKGIAFYKMGDYSQAITCLRVQAEPFDYRMLHLAKAYEQVEEYTTAYGVLVAIDSVSPYLYKEYQDLLFNIFMNLEDLSLITRDLKKISKPHLREYIQLKIYEKQKNTKKVKTSAWKLITTYPKTVGAHYAVTLVTPATKAQHKNVGKVHYYHGEYDQALEHFDKASKDNAVNYYLGMIHYNRGNNSQALHYFSLSNWSAAYYYKGRTYEKLDLYNKAIAVYDSLNMLHAKSKYASRGNKRKAFLFEDIGDTLLAVQAFLKINEKNTKFRAAMQLYKIGHLSKADSILRISNDAEFVYWRARIGERLGNSVESLKNELATKHPLSYYTLVRYNGDLVFDTTALDAWVSRLGDSTVTFTAQDSMRIQKAIRYFQLNEINYGIAELEAIEDKSAQDYLYLSKLCAQYTADRLSILYSLRVKTAAHKKNVRVYPLELYKLMYPVRYTFTITDQNIDLSLCLAMIWQESLFDPRAVSSANARGIMQIIPPTAKLIADQLGAESYSLYNPSVSIRFGCYYFLDLYRDFNSVALTLAGYNAGPARVKRWVKQDPNYEIAEFIELIPYNETRDYVKYILARQIIYKRLMGV
jgi:soluble lytic murein transglycosylase-like protein